MLQWLLHMEEHCFYLFLIKGDGFTQHLDKEFLVFTRPRVVIGHVSSMYSDDLKEKLQYYSSFCHDDSQLPYVCSVLEHCKVCDFTSACAWRRTLLSLLHQNWNVQRRLMTTGRGHFTSSSADEGQSFFTNAPWVYLLASPAQWCLVCLIFNTWPLHRCFIFVFEFVLTCRFILVLTTVVYLFYLVTRSQLISRQWPLFHNWLACLLLSPSCLSLDPFTLLSWLGCVPGLLVVFTSCPRSGSR